MSEIRYEYEKKELTGLESKYINIPFSLVTNKDADEKRVSAFAYLKMCCGADDISRFIVSDLAEWCGYKADSRRVGGTNDRLLDSIDELSDMGYFTYLTERSRSKYIKCEFNPKYYYEECLNGYSIIYLDEFKKILSYKRKNKNDIYIKPTIVLLVFAWLRNKIIRRPNELKPEERSLDKIKDRKERLPEVYDTNFNIIADEIGVSDRTVSEAIYILECELGLIVTDVPYRTKNKDKEFRTPNTLFANAYKREHKYLLLTDEDYSRKELEQKESNLQKVYTKYKINKDKRKQRKG